MKQRCGMVSLKKLPNLTYMNEALKIKSIEKIPTSLHSALAKSPHNSITSTQALAECFSLALFIWGHALAFSMEDC